MKKITFVIMSVLMFMFGSTISAETMKENNNMVQPRLVTRSVYKTYTYNGYDFILEGNYYTQTNGTVTSSNLKVRAVSSGCSAYGLSQTPSGNSVIVSFNISTPNGGSSVYDVVR